MKSTTEYREYFDQLVNQAEEQIQKDPKAYKRHLKLLVLLGYGVIFALLSLLVGLLGGSVWAALSSSAFILLLLKKKLIFVLVGVVWVLVKSLFIRFEEPEGLPLERKEFPKLWQQIDDLQAELKTPNIHRIIMTAEMNASISQIPRFGMIGPYKNTLTLGLELLLSLSPEQTKSVLAHELAHLSGNHGKFSGWIYRVRLSWLRIQEAFMNSSAWGTGLIKRFINWYTPYFAGYSYVLARDNEYEADALASELTTPKATASALIKTYVYSDLIHEHFWQPLYKKANTQSEPEQDVYSLLQTFLNDKDKLNEDIVKRAVRSALMQKTNTADTHPSLMDRLKSLKTAGQLEKSDKNAAHEWLDIEYEHIIDHFNQQWINENSENWKSFHNDASQAKVTLAELSSKEPEQRTQNDLWNIAALTERYLPGRDPLPLYQDYYKHFPEDSDGLVAVGRLMLDNNESQGIHYLKKVYKEVAYKQSVAEILWRYYQRLNDKEQAEIWLRNAESAYGMMCDAQQERDVINDTDTIIAPKLADESLEQILLEALQDHPKIKSVWLAQKEVEHFQDKPVFIVGLEMKAFTRKAAELLHEVAQDIDTGHLIFYVNKSISKKIMKKIINSGKKIY